MHWYENLFLGESVRGRCAILKYRISNRMIHPSVYLLAWTGAEGSLFEIIPSSCLLQRGYPSERLHILGIAGYRKEALALAETVIREVYHGRGDFNVRSYMEQGRPAHGSRRNRR